jgi:hypothetical protein
MAERIPRHTKSSEQHSVPLHELSGDELGMEIRRLTQLAESAPPMPHPDVVERRIIEAMANPPILTPEEQADVDRILPQPPSSSHVFKS